MPYEIPTQLAKCVKCKKEYEIHNKWPFIACKECVSRINEEMALIWIYEILGYDDNLTDFTVPILKSASKAAINEYYVNFDPDKKLGFRALALKAKEKMLSDSANENRKCEKCQKDYNVNVLWPYIICKDCARREGAMFRELKLDVLDIDEEYLDIMPPIIPGVNVDKYRIDQVKASMDNRANQLNPNNDAFDRSRGQ